MGSYIEIYVDEITGVNYVYFQNGNSGGGTPLLDKEGRVAVTPLNSNDSYDQYYK